MTRQSSRLTAVIGAALLLAAFVPLGASADSVADFYKAKGFTILVGSGAGGGTTCTRGRSPRREIQREKGG